MVFSSIIFIYYFLPLLLIIYFAFPKKYRNLVLLLFSLCFYFYGEKNYIFLLLGSCFFNYIIGLLIEKKKQKRYLVIGIIVNLCLLGYFKYTNFFIENFNSIFNLSIKSLNVILPLGISFFTFQNISYIADVYRNDVKAQRNFLTYSTYITFFPQLVAGPIVRYKDINDELIDRKESYSLFSQGVTRFLVGLGKKVLIANTIFSMCTFLEGIVPSTIGYWLLAIGYTLNIYFDFSGYSDMAIGLGKMFGFNFLENFNYPLTAVSVTDFWRRWHISLSSFFRDYIYIPLGGNRVSFIKMLRNIFVVWTLTGFWHGASWNFIFWGLYFFIFLMIEKLFLLKHLNNKIVGRIYTFIVVLISFIIFNITDLDKLFITLKGMIGINVDFINFETIYCLKNYLIIIIIAFIGMTPVVNNMLEKLKKGKSRKIIEIFEVLAFLIILVLVTASLISNSFNPFIYFRF